MNRSKIIYLNTAILLTLFFSSTILSQSLIDGAESVAFDSLNNRYLVTSLQTNKVISIDKSGNQQVFKNSIVAYGNCTKDSVLYVTGNSTIRGLNVFTGEDVFSVTIPGTQQLDGITVDNSGHLYVMATRIGRVYKINIETKTYSQFVDGGFGRGPQDLIFDKFNNRILVCHWSTESPIMSINLEDSTMTTVVEKTAGFADGITIDQYGNIYVTSYNGEGEIYMYDNDFSKPEELIYVGVEEPAGLDYNIIDDVLAVPSFSGDKVVFINMPATYLFPKMRVNVNTGHRPLTVEFTDLSGSNPKINVWEWDFNNDGTIDSYEQNPEWTFDEPGVYKIGVSFYSDLLSKSLLYEDSILVFDGESSINFAALKSVVKVNPTTELNLKNEWTFETWLNLTTLHGKYILDKNTVAIYTNKSSSGYAKNSLVVKFILEDDSIIRFTTEDSSLTLNQWQHIALAYNYSNQKIEIYIDGELQELSVDYNSIFSLPIKDNDNDTLLLGNSNSSLRALRGSLDEIRIWNKALTKEEIDLNRYNYLNGAENNLITYWNFNEGNGESITDISNNENTGKIFDAKYYWGINYDELVGINKKETGFIIPEEFKLFQNYPNPFNPETIINYSIPHELHVSINVYDVVGNLIATILDENKSAGNHKIKFDANKITSGVYFYQIVAGSFIQTKKMILIH
jgi:PKD repeat protein